MNIDENGACGVVGLAETVEGRVRPTGALAFGRWLHHRMAEEGWNQVETAAVLGVSRSEIRRWLHGLHPPAPVSLGKIAKALGEDASYLMVLAGHTPHNIQTEPHRDAATLARMVERVRFDYDPGRAPLLRGILQNMLDADRRKGREEDGARG